MKEGPIFVVDADADDRDLMREICRDLQLPNELCFFSRGQDLINHLAKENEPPFVILSEVNLPGMDGFELRRHLLDEDSGKFRSVPFIFWSNKASDSSVRQAYDLASHGFFLKPASFSEMKQSLQVLIGYWQVSQMPQKPRI